MLIIKIKWWLWNQMFQYAYIRALSLRTNNPFLLDVKEYDYYKYRNYELWELFNIKWNICKDENLKFYQRLYSTNKYFNFLCTKAKDFSLKFNTNHFVEKDMLNNKKWENSIIDNKFLSIKEGYIEWYFQSLKYFEDFEDTIIKDFTFKKELSEKSREIVNDIENSESVSIHVRRWDYLNKEYIDTYWVCSIEYFYKWIDIIKRQTNSPLKFFVFSDDINWCRANLKQDDIYYIDRNTWKDSWQDMALMSKCKHNIIANSSFSWWWAELNRNPDKIVIAPKERYKKKDVYQNDIIPNSWTKL